MYGRRAPTPTPYASEDRDPETRWDSSLRTRAGSATSVEMDSRLSTVSTSEEPVISVTYLKSNQAVVMEGPLEPKKDSSAKRKFSFYRGRKSKQPSNHSESPFTLTTVDESAEGAEVPSASVPS